ncbi:hypothetical protein ACA910_000235 [Epithemia clementina (nom. ined.)]
MWATGATGIALPGAAAYRGPAANAMQSQVAAAAAAGGGGGTNPKNDIFVGNLAFNTTEEQLLQAFSEIGRVLNVRLVTDIETGKPRGFAFVEFEDPQAALSAIRNMNDYELNGRRLRVNFSNSSHLEVLAGKLGMDLSQQTQRTAKTTPAGAPTAAGSAGTSVVAEALKGFSKGEAYDVIAKLKEMAERDPDEARRVISGHPQLPEALLFLMSNKLDMVKTPIPTIDAVLPPTTASSTLTSTTLPSSTNPASAAGATTRAADPRARTDPRMASAATTASAAAVQPAANNTGGGSSAAPPARLDPRQRVDPRIKQEQAPSQQQPQQPSLAVPTRQPQQPPPPPPPLAHMPQQQQTQQQQPFVNHAPHLDPTLVRQVMALTPEMLQQLPPDKRQSILQLRQQITGGHGM